MQPVDRRVHRVRAHDARSAPAPTEVRRRQISHDIEHQLSTIVMLASAVTVAPDIGEESRQRVAQILDEARWLSGLVHIYEDALDVGTTPRASPTRLDLLIADVLRPLRMSSGAGIGLESRPVSAVVDRLAFWRALRNLLLNAIDAAGPHGGVWVRVFGADEHAVVEVEDTGPGFTQQQQQRSSLGLTIVETFAAANSGRLVIMNGSDGGCIVRLELPEAPEVEHGR